MNIQMSRRAILVFHLGVPIAVNAARVLGVSVLVYLTTVFLCVARSLQSAVAWYSRSDRRRQCRFLPDDSLVHKHVPHAVLQSLVPGKGTVPYAMHHLTCCTGAFCPWLITWLVARCC